MTNDDDRTNSTRRERGGCVSVRAECMTCGWLCESKNAQGVGVQHARQKGHNVHVEKVLSYIYDYDD